MKSYITNLPKPLKWIFPKRVWAFSNKEKALYLTFDDGPIPNLTTWVLAELKKYDAKATFFCIGKNIEANPGIFQQLLEQGHSIGNHTYNHLNANKTSSSTYIENTQKAQLVIDNQLKKYTGKFKTEKKLFRPPYGKLSFKKGKLLRGLGYDIIMWDVLSADFDTKITKEKCLENVLKNAASGSIIIFHDSLKAENNLKYALPQVLSYFSKKGYQFKAIN